MRTLTLTVNIADEDFEAVRPVLENTIDEDTLLGVRLKDVEHAAENVLAPQVYVTPLSFEVE
jgi:hypothetical protein